ncbi:unnamed protein product, partial [Meganyctiphanes norvegica]
KMDNKDDVILIAEGQSFPCKRSQLITKSDYFMAMFSNNFTEHEKNQIELQDIDSSCLGILLEYVSKGTITLPGDSQLLDLLQTAAMLQFSVVQAACEEQMLTSMRVDTCLEIYYATTNLGLSHLSRAARTLALWWFQKFSTKPQFLKLELHEILDYVGDNRLHCGTNGEWSVWEAIYAWIQEDELERSDHIVELLSTLDFQSLSQDDVANMLFYDVISQSPQATEILETLRECRKHNQDKRNEKYSEIWKDNDMETQSSDQKNFVITEVKKFLRKPKRKLPFLPCVVGFKRSNTIKKKKAKLSDDESDSEPQTHPNARRQNMSALPVVYSFDPVNKTVKEVLTLTKLCEGPIQCSGYQVCSIGPSIYILGGEYLLGHSNWNKENRSYNTATHNWTIHPSLPQPRRHHMACVLDHDIYLLGGFGKHRVVQSSVDAFDTSTGIWRECSDMPQCVSNGAVCAYKKRLLLFTQDLQLFTYFPERDRWSSSSLASPHKQGYRAALSWENSIYLIDNCSTKVYKFSPEEGKTINYFGRFIAPSVNVCIIDGKIYSFSHDDVDDGHVIEVLNVCDDSRKNNYLLELRRNEDKLSANRTEHLGKDHFNNSHESNQQGSSHSADEPSNHIVIAQEVWRERDDEPHLFTTKCPADLTFSFGCFPVMKISS